MKGLKNCRQWSISKLLKPPCPISLVCIGVSTCVRGCLAYSKYIIRSSDSERHPRDPRNERSNWCCLFLFSDFISNTGGFTDCGNFNFLFAKKCFQSFKLCYVINTLNCKSILNVWPFQIRSFIEQCSLF